jgi:hypothetical protein
MVNVSLQHAPQIQATVLVVGVAEVQTITVWMFHEVQRASTVVIFNVVALEVVSGTSTQTLSCVMIPDGTVQEVDLQTPGLRVLVHVVLAHKQTIVELRNHAV